MNVLIHQVAQKTLIVPTHLDHFHAHAKLALNQLVADATVRSMNET